MRETSDAQLRILVVDDNEDTALSLAFLFRTCGHDVRAAHDGLSALEAAREFRPDAVVLDIGMPGMDGFEAARRLRLLPGGAELLIVGASGYSQEKDRRRANEVGIDVYLAKPFDPWRLEKILARRRTPQTVSA